MRPPTLIFIVVATGVRSCKALIDLSKPYSSKSSTPDSEGQKLIEIAEAEDDIHAFLALECGMVVAEYGDQEEIRHLFSITKSWTGLLMGAAEKEGLLTLNETLWDIWPDEAIWESVEDAEYRKKTTLEQLSQMTGGYSMPKGFMKDVLVDVLPFTDNRLGGKDFQDSLTYHPLNTTNIGSYEYVMASNLVSYIIKKKTGMVPEDYAKEKVFPFLGIKDDDYEWYVNPDQVSTGFHGLKMSTTALSKLGSLYLQNGMANNETQIVDPSWIERSFTIGDERAPPKDKFGYIGWWLGTEPAYASYGFGGQRLGINTETHRVLAILSDTYYKDAGVDTYDDPKATFPTDQILQQFVFAEASKTESGEPFVCETLASPVVPDPNKTSTTTDTGATIPGATEAPGSSVATTVLTTTTSTTVPATKAPDGSKEPDSSANKYAVEVGMYVMGSTLSMMFV